MSLAQAFQVFSLKLMKYIYIYTLIDEYNYYYYWNIYYYREKINIVCIIIILCRRQFEFVLQHDKSMNINKKDKIIIEF